VRIIHTEIPVGEESGRIIPVEINGQRYPIRSGLDEQYVRSLASYVDQKIRAAGELTPTTDSLRLVVLAALNIADEYFRCRDAERNHSGRLAERTEKLERLLDEVLIS
jgi:cell division protein ZapA